MGELRFGNLKLLKFIGRIDKGQGHIRKELNLVQWYDNPSQYDLRIWDMTNEPIPTKGISFSYSELETLLKLLIDIVAEHQGKGNPKAIGTVPLLPRGGMPKPMRQQAQKPPVKQRKAVPSPKVKPRIPQKYPPRVVIAPDVTAITPPLVPSKTQPSLKNAVTIQPRPLYTPRSAAICNYPSCNEQVYRDGFCKDHFSHERYTSK